MRYVVVLDGASHLRAVPGVVRLLEDGRTADIFIVCAERTRESLPGECAAVVDVGPAGTTVTGPSGAVTRVIADRVGSGWVERFARALAPLRDSTPAEASAGVDHVRLLDLLGDRAVDASALAATWAWRPRSTEAVLGATADGNFTVDLRHDGPHALIGGTTGSGKSELLRTLITSLAVA